MWVYHPSSVTIDRDINNVRCFHRLPLAFNITALSSTGRQACRQTPAVDWPIQMKFAVHCLWIFLYCFPIIGLFWILKSWKQCLNYKWALCPETIDWNAAENAIQSRSPSLQSGKQLWSSPIILAIAVVKKDPLSYAVVNFWSPSNPFRDSSSEGRIILPNLMSVRETMWTPVAVKQTHSNRISKLHIKLL